MIQSRNRLLKLRRVVAEHLVFYDAPSASEILFQTFFQWDVEGEGYGGDLIDASDPQQSAPGASFQIRRVNHSHSPQRQPGSRNVAEQAEGGVVDALIVFVVANRRAAAVGRDDFSRVKMTRRKS